MKNQQIKQNEFINIANNEALKLQEAGYRQKEKIFNTSLLNCISTPLMMPFCILLYMFARQFNDGFFDVGSNIGFAVTTISLLLLSAWMHEMIHAVCIKMFQKSSNGIRFRFSYLTAYCAYCLPMKKTHYIITSLAPTIVLTLILGSITILTNSFAFAITTAVMLVCGGGDIIISSYILTCNKCKYVLEHPEKCGVYTFQQEDNII